MLVGVLLSDGVEQIEVPDEELLSFPRGVVGFEEYDRYVLLELDQPFYLLQSVDDPHVGFVLMDPSLVDATYEVALGSGDRELLGLRRSERPGLFCIVTLSAEGGNATVNLRAPVAVNLRKRLGAQVILQDVPYPVRYPLALTAEGTLDLGTPDPSGSRNKQPSRNGSHGRRQEAMRCSS